MESHNLQPPYLGRRQPDYPPLIELLRLPGGTVPGPSGYASSSALQPSLYIGFIQQVVPGTLLPRDRIPCFVLDVNRYGLAPGYYSNCRLVGSHQSLPVYAVADSSYAGTFAFMGSPASAPGTGGGLTPAQYITLQSLTPQQLANLNNLTPCQLQTLLTALPPSQIQTLTLTLTPTQIGNLVNLTTTSQLTNLYSQLTTSQLITLTSNLNQQQIQTLIQTLTAPQIQNLITSLTTTQLLTLTTLPPAQIEFLVTNLTIPQLQTFLNVGTSAPLPPLIPIGYHTITGSSYTVVAADLWNLMTINSSSSTAITLPSASTFGPGWTTSFQNLGSGTITLTPTSGTIDGGASLNITSDQGATIVSDGSNWIISTPVAGSSVGGGTTRWTVTSVKTADYTASFGEFVLVDSSGGGFTVTLPAASGGSGKAVAVKQTSSSTLNTVTVDGNGAETIDDAASITLSTTPAFNCFVFVCDGTEWWIEARKTT